jgi:3-hexulose-6-phosphate synthase
MIPLHNGSRMNIMEHNMTSKPIIQVAMDYIQTRDAVEMARVVAPVVEAIEIGTPLCKAEGMHAVRAVREICPDHILMADMKTPDVGGLEAKIAFDAGANWMTVLGAAPTDTLRLAMEEAAARPGHEILVELTGIQNILARARTWREMGVERMVYHRGWDEGNTSRTWDRSDRETLEALAEMGFKLSVAGGLDLATLDFFADLPIAVFIIGRAIRETPDPAATARTFQERLRELWGSAEG